MAYAVARAIKRPRVGQRNRLKRRHCYNRAGVGLRRVDTISLLAHRHRLAAHQRVPVIVFDLAPWTAVNHGMIAVPARAFLALHGTDCDRSELDSLHGAPWLGVALDDLDTVKARLLKCGQKGALFHRPRDASAPQI